MTEKQMNALGFHRDGGNKYMRWCDGRYIEVRILEGDDFDDVWNSIYDWVWENGISEGRRQKSEEIRKSLGVEEN
jgi:hypothetical protein